MKKVALLFIFHIMVVSGGNSQIVSLTPVELNNSEFTGGASSSLSDSIFQHGLSFSDNTSVARGIQRASSFFTQTSSKTKYDFYNIDDTQYFDFSSDFLLINEPTGTELRAEAFSEFYFTINQEVNYEISGLMTGMIENMNGMDVGYGFETYLFQVNAPNGSVVGTTFYENDEGKENGGFLKNIDQLGEGASGNSFGLNSGMISPGTYLFGYSSYISTGTSTFDKYSAEADLTLKISEVVIPEIRTSGIISVLCLGFFLLWRIRKSCEFGNK